METNVADIIVPETRDGVCLHSHRASAVWWCMVMAFVVRTVGVRARRQAPPPARWPLWRGRVVAARATHSLSRSSSDPAMDRLAAARWPHPRSSSRAIEQEDMVDLELKPGRLNSGGHSSSSRFRRAGPLRRKTFHHEIQKVFKISRHIESCGTCMKH